MTGEPNLYAADAARWWDGSRRWLRVLRNLVPVRLAVFDPLVGDWAGLDVLDLGCGGGFMAEALAERGARVVGVDPCAAAIGAARAHAAGRLAIDYRTGAGEALPLGDGTVDAVVCVDVLEHVADLPRVLAEARRVLRPGGLFLFDTINRTRLARFAIVTLGERVLRLLPAGTHDPALFVPPAELARHLAAAGFGEFAARGLGPRRLDRRLDLVFGPYPTLAVLYIGHARKVAA